MQTSPRPFHCAILESDWKQNVLQCLHQEFDFLGHLTSSHYLKQWKVKYRLFSKRDLPKGSVIVFFLVDYSNQSMNQLKRPLNDRLSDSDSEQTLDMHSKTNISGLCVGGLGCVSVEWFWPRSTSRRPLALNGSLPWESPLSNAQLSSTSSASGWWVKESRPPFKPSALTRPPSLCRARAALANSVWEAECVLWRCLLNSCCFFSTNKTLLLLQKQVRFDDHSMLLALFRMLAWAVVAVLRAD